MNLNSYILNQFEYSLSCPIPVGIEITSEESVEITDKWDIKELIFMKNGKEKAGVSCTAKLNLPKFTYEISPYKPKYFIINVCDYIENISTELSPGDYDLVLTIVVCVVKNSGKHKFLELKTSIKVTLN